MALNRAPEIERQALGLIPAFNIVPSFGWHRNVNSSGEFGGNQALIGKSVREEARVAFSQYVFNRKEAHAMPAMQLIEVRLITTIDSRVGR